jgi:hypothetical protein
VEAARLEYRLVDREDIVDAPVARLVDLICGLHEER